ncbi:MAG: hypothetical protein ACOX52_17385 [Verrucomicrobiota bacterium]
MLYRAGIDPDPDFDFDRTDRIHCLEAMREGACLFGGFSHRGHRVHREVFPFAIDETPPTSAGLC